MTARLGEREARTLLLIEAIEETDQDGVLLAPRTRAAASRRAFDDPSQSPDDLGRLRARASLLRDDVLRDAPALGYALAPPRARGAVVLTVVAVAAITGALTNLLGPERRVSVLAFPLASILAWNLAVYAALAARAITRTTARLRRSGDSDRRSGDSDRRPGSAPGILALAGRWLEGAGLAASARRSSGQADRRGATTPSVAVADAVRRFQRLWLPVAAPLIAARTRAVLHVGAFAMALGAIAGMYVSGIAFEYRATWESTWLDAPAVQRYLDAVLAPAARVLDTPVPDVAPLRGPAGEGAAGPWIHLWGTTLALFVLIPRAALALADALRAAHLARRLPVAVDPGYVRRALASGRGAATRVEIVYYSGAPDPAGRERLHTRLQEEVGARAVIGDGVRIQYGDGPENVEVPDGSAQAGLVVLVFPLAQTPEVEVHGEFITDLRERLDRAGCQLLVVLDTAAYRQRVGSEDRVRERRATWDRLLRSLEVAAIDLDATP
jgi:hypothetical protein